MISDIDSCLKLEDIIYSLHRSNSEHFSKDPAILEFDHNKDTYEFESLDTTENLSEIQPLKLVLKIIYYCKLIFTPKSAGKRRKMKNSDNVLKWFKLIVSFETQNEKPKLEYFRLRLIRALKKILRLIYENIVVHTRKKKLEYSKDLEEKIDHLRVFPILIAQKGKLKLNALRQDQVSALKILINLAKKNSIFLKEFSKTLSGPLTENKKKSSTLLNKPITKSMKRKNFLRKNAKNLIKGRKSSLAKKAKLNTFNNTWVEENFDKEVIRDTYKAFIDYLFAGKTMEQLKKTFKVDCCTDMDSNFSICSDKWRQLYKFCLTSLVLCHLA